MTCLDTLLDRASDRNERVTWGADDQGPWVRLHTGTGPGIARRGETRDEAAESLLIALLDVEVAA